MLDKAQVVGESHEKIALHRLGIDQTHRHQGAEPGPSQNPPLLEFSVLRDLGLSTRSSFLLSVLLLPDTLVLHWLCIFLWRSSSAAETSRAHGSISPLSHGSSDGEAGAAQGRGEGNTYLKEKGLGRASLCPLHSASLCDY